MMPPAIATCGVVSGVAGHLRTYFPKVKMHGGGSTVDRAPIAIIKVRPPYHWKNEISKGDRSPYTSDPHPMYVLVV